MSNADYHFNKTMTLPIERVLECEEALYRAAGMSK